MADQDDVRRIALSLPATAESPGSFDFSIAHPTKPKSFVWAWRERVHPKKPKVPNPDVVVLPTVDLEDKEALLAMAPDRFFTEPHYNGYPAILVRLSAVSVDELTELITDACRLKANPAQLAELAELDG